MCSCSGLNYVLPQPLYLWIWPSLFVNKVFGDVIKLTWGHRRLGSPDSSVGKQFSCNARNPSSIPGLGRSPGEGKGYPLQFSGLKNSMGCMVHGVAKSRTWLSDFHFTLIEDKGEPSPSDWCPYNGGAWAERHPGETLREDGSPDWSAVAATQEHQGAPGTTRSWKRRTEQILPQSPQREQAPLIPWFQISGSKNQRINFCCFSVNQFVAAIGINIALKKNKS